MKKTILLSALCSLLGTSAFAQKPAVPLLLKNTQGGNIVPSGQQDDCAIFENGKISETIAGKIIQSGNSFTPTDDIKTVDDIEALIPEAAKGIGESGLSGNPDTPTSTYTAQLSSTDEVVQLGKKGAVNETNLSSAAAKLIKLLDQNCNK